MNRLRQIEAEYNLPNLKWIKEDELFQSEFGRKRIRIWKDKQLLDWHVKWRDEVSKESSIMTDRMIRTKSQSPYSICDKGWLTIHDEVEQPYLTKGREAEWGEFLAGTLVYGCTMSKSFNFIGKQESLSLLKIKKQIRQLELQDHMAKMVVERTYYEAKKRFESAQSILKKVSLKKVPILNPSISTSNAREVFFQMFFIGGSEEPVQSYSPLRSLLERWLNENGKESFIRLLDEINQSFNLRGEQGMLLLAECLMPYEIQQVTNELSDSDKNRETSKIMDQYFTSWESSRKVVFTLSEWLEHTRKKVAAND